MTILALEFSSEQRSVAIARDGQLLAESAEMGSYRATNAFGLIGKVLAAAGIARGEIQVVAVGLGPGSYTGIRAAIAVAQGWQLASGVNLLGICSAETLAMQAQAAKLFGRVHVIIDAQRGEYYLATWEVSETSLKETLPLTIAAKAEIEAIQTSNAICVGPETGGSILFPSAAMLVRLATERCDFISGNNLKPIYLRETTFTKAPPARY